MNSSNQAMSQFVTMFPSLRPAEIEAVLRRHDGDVALTIDDLLRISEKEENSRKSSRSSVDGDRCIDDEKIALMIQNREFLNYLQRDPEFINTFHRDRESYKPRGRPRRALSTSSHVPAETMVDYSDCSVPNGPLVEMPSTSNSWSQKLKNRFNKRSSLSYCEDLPDAEAFPHTVAAEYYSADDETFARRLRNMSKASKEKFAQVAKRFSREKRLAYPSYSK
ncbi:hypothetical protein L596_023697 [Steinernema carpocapsae]|uniref:CUE domain-containing protein n=1 Tax=Steinernema carpocapsae TaxID=34508 RepID=A0A4V6XVU6_STECR|nr:hypothetical protein L596_023697 [Steinernema carpocapsae]